MKNIVLALALLLTLPALQSCEPCVGVPSRHTDFILTLRLVGNLNTDNCQITDNSVILADSLLFGTTQDRNGGFNYTDAYTITQEGICYHISAEVNGELGEWNFSLFDQVAAEQIGEGIASAYIDVACNGDETLTVTTDWKPGSGIDPGRFTTVVDNSQSPPEVFMTVEVE